ncbi:MAG: hypothetical protein V1774_11425 [Candidatus Eisenbacteria bacterium]
MKCWNCQSPLDEVLICERCGMPQIPGALHPFEILNLPPRLRWRDGELEQAYERLAQRCHPDLFRAHRDERVSTAASSAMRALNDAFREVRDPVRRLRYVLAAAAQSAETTRTVPTGIQDAVQIIERVLARIEEARGQQDRAAWEAEQDHLAALQVKIEAARERSDETMRLLVAEWDDAVATDEDEWPEMPGDWMTRAVLWSGEREYLESVMTRVSEAGTWTEG